MRRTDSPAIRTTAGSPDAFWAVADDELFEVLGTTAGGLTSEVAAERLALAGPNSFSGRRATGDIALLFRQFLSPIILILVAATVISLLLGDVIDSLIILVIVGASGVLGFWQERSASQAIAALLDQVSVSVDVRRSGAVTRVPVEEVAPGDLVLLNAGDVVPGDGRVMAADSLLVDEASLTGEAFPVEKTPGRLSPETPLARRSNALFMGSHVVSGDGAMIVARTGRGTELGSVASELNQRAQPTGFERGITAFGLLLVRAGVVLVLAIFVVNLLLGRPFVESLLFSVALAVGLTPQLLPAIVSVSLSAGARRMANEQVIVKRLDAIEDFGSMTVICTDKTGTLTEGEIALAGAYDVMGAPSDLVWRLAWLNARFQSGYENPLDAAILAARTFANETITCLDEAPYDFARKRLSVLVAEGGAGLLVTKGALQSVLDICSQAEVAGQTVDIDQVRSRVLAEFAKLSSQGLRVLGVATRTMTGGSCSAHDEQGMRLAGLVAFEDSPKAGAAAAVAELTELGVSVRMITGDNALAAAHAGAAVGLDTARAMTGAEIDALSDDALAAATADVAIFAEVQPLQKARIVRALRTTGRVVGFLGDGINDAPALHVADVGISVDTAVDVARQAAAVVLLDKNLSVVADGVRLGRQTFANTLKYINVTTSANFGNMLSMAVAAAFLPFLPLMPRQILLLNILSDIPGTTIASDRVDEDELRRPRSWDISEIRRFMIVFGSISSAFDITTFIVLRRGFGANAGLFHTAWFIESLITELAVMLVLRTRRVFARSRPSTPLLLSSAIIALIALALPTSPLAEPFGLTRVGGGVLFALAAITAGYIAATEVAKWAVLAYPWPGRFAKR